MSFSQYFSQQTVWNQIFTRLIEHITLTAISVGVAILIGVPLGILISYVKPLNKPIIGLSNLIQAIPSIALLGFMIPLLGIGAVPSVTAVVLYSLLPVIKNTYTGIQNIDPQTIEAATGIGLTKFQVLRKVQIPLALPVIMAGVRISAVTAVGLVTMAAYIGAGGLGFLVYTGVSTFNINQIFAGAIPACLLALAVDFAFSIVEKLVTPKSLQTKKTKGGRKLSLKTTAIAIFCIVLAFSATGCQNSSQPGASGAGGEKTITIGGKDFTEQYVIVNLLADMIEAKTDIKVTRIEKLGGTMVCFEALKKGDIDMYLDYTGTCYVNMLKLPLESDMDLVYNTVKDELKKQFDIEVMKPMNFNNTYVLAVRPDTAEDYKLKTISDLAEVGSGLMMSTTFEFAERADGIPGITNHYGFEFKEVLSFDMAARYIALENKEADVVDAFATDGLLKKLGLVVLEDDKSFFPPYYAIPLIRSDTAEKYPEIIPVVESLAEVLTDEVMVELNYMVDEEQKQASVVAHEFLVSRGLID